MRHQKVFDIFLSHPVNRVLFHCTAGKDRTDIISMLILALCGIEDQNIITNYKLVSPTPHMTPFY
ncbi:tyrosine-protein phosphatase [Facklamia lactis]|uniref:tyrosine-protein phosphatase n=1 Tax=Facklamia lactis TaxID=2749967 RepID=UPI0018CD58BB|nr:tyrosine-protein phosphatase [Facklamia lactis]